MFFRYFIFQSPIYSHRVRQVQEESWVHRDFKGPRYAKILMDKYQQLDEGQILTLFRYRVFVQKKITDESRVTFRIHSVADVVKFKTLLSLRSC